MRTWAAILTLLFASLLLVAGCGGGGEAEAPVEKGSKEAAPAEAPAATTPVTTSPTTESEEQQSTLAIINSAGERVVVRVEIADSPAEQTRGLMERTELAEDAGMLFVFDREQQAPFTMKNTLIPLSIAFIDAGGRIVDILDMQPLDETTRYSSAEPYQYALEVNQGFFEARGIEVGNVLE
ncbi:MAG: DUF192 domain-containing protein [Actinomycetota bacterium]|nr:DUF192 domain-containing protein [Actinomycetota bacterium]